MRHAPGCAAGGLVVLGGSDEKDLLKLLLLGIWSSFNPLVDGRARACTNTFFETIQQRIG